MINSKKKGFTLVELVAVLVILAIIAMIVTPLVLTLINKSRAVSLKRSVDAYGKSVEIAVMNQLLTVGRFPTELDSLKVEYTGKAVKCNVMNLNYDGSIHLSECIINNFEVKDDNTEDGWYHYGELRLDGNPAVVDLLALANDVSVTTYNKGSDASHQLYTFNHSATTQTGALTDYRYIGSDPYNYVTFNDELWQILGIFTVENEKGEQVQRIKIIKNTYLGNYAWNSSSTNEWSTSSLQKYLNSTYYNLLNNEAKKMIEKTKYYLGGSSSYSGQTGPKYYAFERGNSVYSGRSKNWIGNIGIMYPSDYTYTYANGVDNSCFNDPYNCEMSNPSSGWVYNGIDHWFISPYNGSSASAFNMRYNGWVGYTTVTNSSSVRPVLYLSEEVRIKEGDGTKTSPYQLML